MKRILLTTIAAGCSFAAFGQGQVAFENYNLSSIPAVNYGPSHTLAPTGSPGFTVALLWNNGSSYQLISTYQSSSAQPAGYFLAGSVTVPTFSATGTFEVEGWYNTAGNFGSLAAAIAANSGTTYTGVSAPFTAAEVQSPTPPTTIAGPGQWNGNLSLLVVPEPSTIALGGLGAAALLLFRRKK